MKIAILGGGLTGLSLGYLLKEKGINFEILEKEKECGGLMRVLKEKGFTFDYGGSHIIFTKDEDVLEFILMMLGNNKIKNKRNTKILYNNRYVKYPFENGLYDLSKEDNFDCIYYFIQNLLNKEKNTIKPPSNLQEWCYYNFGKGIAKKYLIPYNQKIWKYPLEKIGLDWVERIPNPPIEDIIKSSLGIETEGYTHQLYFYYPMYGGIQALINSLENNISEKIILDYKVNKITRQNDKWLIDDGNEQKEYDKIISTIPIHELINMLDVPVEIKNTVNKLKYNSLISVMIGINVPKINNISWLYIPNKDVLTHRISFPSNFSPHVTPEGKSSILAEITCNIDDDIWKMNDQDIIDDIIKKLTDVKIINKSDVCYTNIKRLKYAYVINDLEYKNNLKIIEDYLSRLDIDIIGRFAEFKYLNIDGCIRNTIDYVKNWGKK